MKPFWWEIAGNLLSSIVWNLLFAGSLVWAIWRWWRTPSRVIAPPWRSYFAIGSILLVAVSELLYNVWGIWVSVNGGWSDSPVMLRVFGFGFYAALAGLLASLFGKGILRWPACGLSAVLTFWWIYTGLATDI